MTHIYFNKVFILLVQASLWLPQIYYNAIGGLKRVPDMKFVVSQTLHCLFLPCYFKMRSHNVLFLETSFRFAFFVILWAFCQIMILKIQQERPRFIIPMALRRRLFPHIYSYIRDFDHEVDNESSKQLFQSMNSQDEDRYLEFHPDVQPSY